MENKRELLSQFADVTGVDRERAQFYLESSAWQLEVALASFYENDGEMDDTPALEQPDADIEEIPSRTPVTTRQSTAAAATGGAAGTGSAPKKEQSRFATITDFNRPNENSSDEEEGQAFYAGGSEHSGQQVLGPGKKKKDFVTEMFRSVQQRGAEVVESRPRPEKKSSSFSGTGYRLGQSADDSEVIQTAGTSRTDIHTEVVLKLWKEGFSINDGPLRSFTDPDNMEFLESVRRGEVPQELIREAHGREVDLNMEDHRHEDYAESKPKLKVFSGKGHLLGSPSPATVGITIPLDEKDRTANEEQARGAIPVDPEQPVTTVQIRLADGSRLVGRFNVSHTVADVRRYITIARPQYEHQTFNLLTTFPSKELESNLTLDQAGLLNAAVLQRLV